MSLYKIIGGDLREYGPVTADQVRTWIAEGRLNAESQVREEGSPDWRPLSSFPEFANAPAAPAFTLPPPPASAPSDLPTLTDLFAKRAATLDLELCFRRSWALLLKHFWLIVGSSALILVMNVALGLLPVVGALADALFHLVLWGGLQWMLLKLIRGEPAGLNTAFAGFELGFVHLLLAGVVTTVLIFIGLLLCIFPGIYLIVAWLPFVCLLIMDKKMEFWPALELSRRVVTRHFLLFFVFFLLTLALMVAGLLLLGVGVFIAIPLINAAVVYAYEDIFGQQPTPSP